MDVAEYGQQFPLARLEQRRRALPGTAGNAVSARSCREIHVSKSAAGQRFAMPTSAAGGSARWPAAPCGVAVDPPALCSQCWSRTANNVAIYQEKGRFNLCLCPPRERT